jgi:transposase-like protein
MERRKFTHEYKLEAVRLIKDRGVSYVQASQDLGVHTSQLRDWVKKFADDPEHAFPGHGQMKPEQLEIARLKREVTKHIAVAKKAKATLIIAKLDRLARNVHFISGLMESGVDFVAADNPHANKLMVHLLAAFAEHEREQISQRTKDALAAAKARGIRLGRNGADRLAPAYRAEAVERARQLAPLLTELKGAGMSARRMAAELTTHGIATPSGGRWHAQTVLRMIDRAGSAHTL